MAQQVRGDWVWVLGGIGWFWDGVWVVFRWGCVGTAAVREAASHCMNQCQCRAGNGSAWGGGGGVQLRHWGKLYCTTSAT
jgi:hypothetical protein